MTRPRDYRVVMVEIEHDRETMRVPMERAAKLMGTTMPTVKRWCLGKSNPPQGYAVRYAHVIADPMYGRRPEVVDKMAYKMRRRAEIERGSEDVCDL